MAATWCLIKSETDKFKKALLNGQIDPFKLVDMTSEQRTDLFAKVVSEDNAKQINALFESKLLLKNQIEGYKKWVKEVSGITPTVKRDMLSRIEKMDRILSPQEGEQFLQELASKRLNIDITEQEAKNISDLSKEVVSTKSKAKEDGTFQTPEDRFAYGIAKVNLEAYVNELKIKSRQLSFREQPLKKVVQAIAATPGTMKSIVASLDNSFWGRQGMKTLADPRTSKIWIKGFLKSWKDIGIALKGGDAVESIRADIYSRPNALNGKYDAGNYGLSVLTEEAFPSSFPEKIPLLGRLFKASEQAYNGAALRLRADLADRIIRIADKNGINTLSRADAQPLGQLVRSITGRGGLGKAEALSKEANALLFSVKFLKSNIDTLLAPAKYAATKAGLKTPASKGAAFAEKEAAKNSMYILATLTSVLVMAKLLDPESVDEDPRSTNFGKIKVLGHWVDISGGMASLITLAARVATGKSKSSTGNWTDLRSGEFGQKNALDVINDFWAGKLSPFAGIVRDILKGENFQGDPTLKDGKLYLENLLPNVTIPLSIQNFNQLKNDPNSSSILGSMILEGLGLSTSTYKQKTDWETSDSVMLKQFKEKVGEETFKKANDDFNRAYSNWLDSVSQTEEYKNLSEDSKDTLKSDAKEVVRDKIFEEYNFKYKKEKDTEQEKTEKKQIKELLPKEISSTQPSDILGKLVDGIGSVLSAFSSTATASDNKDKQLARVLFDEENRIAKFVYEEGGLINVESKPIDELYKNEGLWAEIGKRFNNIGQKYNLPELTLSEKFGFKNSKQRIEAFKNDYNAWLVEVKKALDKKESEPEASSGQTVIQNKELLNKEGNAYYNSGDSKSMTVKGGTQDRPTVTQVPDDISNTLYDIFGEDLAIKAIQVLHHPYGKQVKREGNGENADFKIKNIDASNEGWDTPLGSKTAPGDVKGKDGMYHSQDRGLFRINSRNFTDSEFKRMKYRMEAAGIDISSAESAWNDMEKLDKNVAMAKIIYKEGGWGRWYAAPADFVE
jgi:hypothetical protein